MEDDIRVSWAVGTTDVTTFGASLGRRVEQRATAVAVSPHALDGLLQNKILLRRPHRLRDLQTVLLGLLGDHVDGRVLVVIDLLREPGAFFTALVAAAAADLLGAELLLALVALAVHADADILCYSVGGTGAQIGRAHV